MLYYVIISKWTNYSGIIKHGSKLRKFLVNTGNWFFDRIDLLIDFPEFKELDIITLKNHRYDFRMRVGRYRVLFDHDDIIKIVEIQEVKKRDEHTY